MDRRRFLGGMLLSPAGVLCASSSGRRSVQGPPDGNYEVGSLFANPEGLYNGGTPCVWMLLAHDRLYGTDIVIVDENGRAFWSVAAFPGSDGRRGPDVCGYRSVLAHLRSGLRGVPGVMFLTDEELSQFRFVGVFRPFDYAPECVLKG